jgi:hypothetical protein
LVVEVDVKILGCSEHPLRQVRREHVTFDDSKFALIPQPLLPMLGEGEPGFKVPLPMLGEGLKPAAYKKRVRARR